MNRKQRRSLAKQLGLFKNMTSKRKEEIKERARIAGPQLHRQFIQNAEANIRSQEVDKDNKIIEDLVSTGKTRQEAEIELNNKKEHAMKREVELMERRERQKEDYITYIAAKNKK
jgi:hypothetical protein